MGDLRDDALCGNYATILAQNDKSVQQQDECLVAAACA
jgi:hypothetical protein